jgi:hypothetical protein
MNASMKLRNTLLGLLGWALVGSAVQAQTEDARVSIVGPGATPSPAAQSPAVRSVAGEPGLLDGSDLSLEIRRLHKQPTTKDQAALPFDAEEPPATTARRATRVVRTRGSLPTDASSLTSSSSTASSLEASSLGDGPLGIPDRYAVANDKVLSIAAPGFLANDIDLNGEALTAVSIADNVDHGTLAAFADGRFTYTPDAGYTGPDSFTYRMRDASSNLSEPVLVRIDVLPAGNRTPIGTPDVYSMLADTTLSVPASGFLVNDIDLDGEAISAVSIQDNVDHGSLAAFADGSFIYTPDPGFAGVDSFTYRMRDASSNFSDPVTVTIQISEGNRVPIGVADQYAVRFNTALTIAAPGFLANDVDLDGEALSAVSISDNVDHGTLAAFADGRFTYTPDAGYTGPDSFSYRMRDASDNFSDPVVVTLTVFPEGVLPVGTPDLYLVPADRTLTIAAPGFLANDIDLNGEPLSAVSITDNVDHGTLAAFADGRFTYTPDAGYTGPDSFTYRMRDASDNFSDPILVTIEVLPAANRTPIGTPDAYTMLAGKTLDVAARGFLVNDVDPDGEAITAVSIQDNVDFGTLAAFADGRFTYTPNAGFVGTDSFTYRMSDASGNVSDPVTVAIEVYAGNRTPIGIPDQYAVLTNGLLSIAAPGFLANDVDLDGEAISAVSIADNVDHGSLAAFADGRFTYTPAPGFAGPDGFAYRMSDASGNVSDPVPVVISVINPDAACVSNLAARAKSGQVQLTWTHTGAHHYNVYRGTIDGGPYLKIGSTTSTYSTYLDRTVVNGTRYYYVVREANALDVELCQSNQATARAIKR